MPSRERVYKIRLPDGSYRLVEATSRRKAINHIADSMFKAFVATADDLYAAWCDGIEVEFPGVKELIASSESPAN